MNGFPFFERTAKTIPVRPKKRPAGRFQILNKGMQSVISPKPPNKTDQNAKKRTCIWSLRQHFVIAVIIFSHWYLPRLCIVQGYREKFPDENLYFMIVARKSGSVQTGIAYPGLMNYNS